MSPARPPSVDDIILVEPGRRAVTARNVAATLDVFDSHFPRFPVLPGVFLLDTMIETAKLVVAESLCQWQAAAVDVVRFRHFVQPGDRVLVEAELIDGTDRIRITARVDDRTVATCRALTLTRVPEPVGVTS